MKASEIKFEFYRVQMYWELGERSFDYANHPILKWLEDNIGNQAKDKPIGQSLLAAEHQNYSKCIVKNQ